MAAVHLGWRPAWDFTCGCGQGRPNPVAMVRRPSSSTSMRASRSSRVTGGSRSSHCVPIEEALRHCENDRLVYALSFRAPRSQTTVRISVWLSFHQRDNDKQSPTLLLGPRDLAVQHQKTTGIGSPEGARRATPTKQTALTQQNNSNTTRVKRAPKTILLGKEKPQITRKFMEAE